MVVKRGVSLVKKTLGGVVRHSTKSRFGLKFLLISLMLLGITVGVLKTLERDVQASWSPTHGNWLKRQRLNVVNSSPATLHANTPIAISIDTKALFDQRKIKPDCSDLRILYQPSDTVYTELPRSLVFPGGGTCSTSTATKVYFNLQTDLTTTSTSTLYYLYYNNPQATTPSNSDNAFDMGDTDALLVCPFSGSTTCAAGETPSTATGAIRYGGAGSALSFDGKNDVVTGIASSSLNISEAITLEAWVNPSRIPSNDGDYGIIRVNNSATGIMLELRGGGTNYNKVSIWIKTTNNTWQQALTSTLRLSQNTWNHVAATYTSGSLKIFINGVASGSSSSFTGNISYSADPEYSMGNWPSDYFPGLIDETRVSNIVRYSSNFTPQSSPFVRDEYTKLLLHFDENGDDPRNTGKAIDDSGNGNHGTITGAKYVAGLVGVDGGTNASVIASGAKQSQSYASHEGVFIEEGTTNKITNPSFEHTTFNTNWTGEATATTFNLATASATFTPSMAKRNSAGPFAAGVMVQGDTNNGVAASTTTDDAISYDRGTQIGGNFFQNIDTNQGSLVLWYTPEESMGASTKFTFLWTANAGGHDVFYVSGVLVARIGGSTQATKAVNLVGGTTYLITIRWDTLNDLAGGNNVTITVNDEAAVGGITSPTAYTPNQAQFAGNWASNTLYTANGIIEGLTIYRRPLWDGTYGINVGNGDEIESIYNAGTGKDPTLVTGSWDVVFALPTNSTTGTLSTGEGNAWTHPHLSNLVGKIDATAHPAYGFMMNGTYTSDGWGNVGSPTTVAALATAEKIYAGGYKSTSDAANEGIYASFASTSGQDFVVRAVGHSDGTCAPRVLITRADGTTEVTHLDGTTASIRTAPNNYIFTFESPAAENLQVQLINTATTGTCYWHQVEVLGNLVNNPSFENSWSGADPNVPGGWTAIDGEAGELSAETTEKKAGTYSVKFTKIAVEDIAVQQTLGSITANTYYTFGGAFKVDIGTIHLRDLSFAHKDQAANTTTPTSSATSTSWTNYYHVMRSVGTTNAILYSGQGCCSAMTAYGDDYYTFPLTPISLTATPASAANSLETTGVRVDGSDTLTQTISGITASAGTVRFKFTPRHSYAEADLFGIAQPIIATIYYDANDFIQIEHASDSLIRMDGYFNGVTEVTATGTPPALNAGTTYDFEVSYASGGSLTLKINGVQIISNTGVISFQGAPTTLYVGSTSSGARQYDATFGSAGVLSATENTTAPYVKFGSKSIKLVDTTNTAKYLTSIDPDSTATHTLSAYVYDGTTGNVGGTVSSSIAKLVFGGTTVTPASYTDMGGGWWRLSYSAATVDATSSYGVEVQAGKTIYMDGVQLEEKPHTHTYTDGSLGAEYSWAGTPHASSSTRTAANLRYPITDNLSLSSGSMSLWWKPQETFSYAVTYAQGIFDTNTTSNNSFRSYYSPGSLFFIVNKDNTQYTHTRSVTLNPRSWVHLTYIWGNGEINIYVNGVAGTATPTSLPTSTGSNLSIGSYLANANYSDATISDLRIYNSAISTNQVSDLYYSGLTSHQETGQTVVIDKFDDTKGENPLSIYHMDEGYGTTVHDATINLNHLTLSGSSWIPARGSTLAGGGGYLKFDGTDDKLSRAFDQDLNFNTESFTLSGLFRHPSTITGTDTLLSRQTGSTGYKIYMNSSGYLCFSVNTDSTCTTTSYADSKWHHFEAVRGASTLTLYIDGEQSSQATGITPTTVNGTNTFYLGIDSDGTSNPFDGFLDEFYIYPSERIAAQVLTDYNNHTSALIGSRNNDNLTDGLVGWWKMDESATPSLDSSGNGNNGTWNGNTTAATGKFGNAASLDGSGDYVDLGSTSILDFPTQSFSYSFWFNSATSQTKNLLSNRTSDLHTYSGFSIYTVANSNSVSARFIDGTQDFVQTVANGIVTNTWYHVTMVWDRESKRLVSYFNGSQINNVSNAAIGNIPRSSTLRIGTGEKGSFNGKFDDVRIYNRALSPVEARQLYEYAPGPIAHWKMDEGSGQSANDSSGNGNTGTVTGASWSTGKFGKALSFDGSDDNVLVNTDPLGTNYTNYTMSAWVKTSATSNRVLFNRTNASDEFPSYVILSNGILSADDYPPGGGSFAGTGSVNHGQWKYVTYVRSGTTRSFYIDGVLDSSQSSSETYSGGLSTKMYLGWDSRNGGQNKFSGLIDDVRIYNYARTQKQIVQDMLGDHPAVTAAGGSATKGKPSAPVAYYKFDEGQGTVANNSGNGGSVLNGAITNLSSPPSAFSGWTSAGKFGKALNFDDTNDYVSIPDNAALDPTDAITYSIWMKATATNSTGFPLRKDGAESYGTYAIYVNSGTVTKTIQCTLGQAVTSVTFSVLANEWHQVTCVYDRLAGKFRGYVDGLLKATSNYSSAIADGGDLQIGGENTSFPYGGAIDEVKVYSYALSDDEVKLDYNRGASQVLGSQAPQDSTSIPSKFSNGLVGWWKMDEITSPSLDSSGNNLSGTWSGNTTYAVGKYSNAASFDGDGDYISVPHNTLHNPINAFTFSAWIKNTSISNYQMIFSKYLNGAGYDFRVTGQRRLSLAPVGLSGVGWNGELIGTTVMTANTWYHATGTYDGSTLSVYLNGNLENSIKVTGNVTASSGDLLIGKRSDGYAWNGVIDEARIYNRALSPREVEDLYNYSPPPLAYWSLDEGVGVLAQDSSGNGNTGTLTSGPTWTSGKMGKAVKFDGVDDYVLTTTPGLISGLTQISLEYWSNSTNVSSGIHTTFSVWPSGFLVYENQDAVQMRVFIDDPNTNYANLTTNALTANTWKHTSIVYNGSGSTNSDKLKVYVNGVNQPLTFTGTIASSIPVNSIVSTIGRLSGSASNHYSGSIDQLRIYNYARTPAQIAWEYNHGAPVGWWKLDECTGTTLNNSGSNGASINGAITIGASGEDTVGTCAVASTAWGSGATGKVGNSLSMDGIDDWIKIGASTVPLHYNNQTVSLWFKPSATLSNGQRRLIDGDYFGIYYDNTSVGGADNTLVGFVHDGTSFRAAYSNATTFDSDTWYHAVLVWNNTTVNLYIDGVKQADQDTGYDGSIGVTSDNVGLGASRSGDASFFAGSLDDVRVYNYALTGAQVKTLYSGGAVKFGN